MATTPRSAPWYAVVIEAEVVPDVLGPYRSLGIAEKTAASWNAKHTGHEEPRAFVVSMSPDLRAIR
jgi:hypothetical protein